jgi:tetratricopeptide (TPR) repeat protein
VVCEHEGDYANARAYYERSLRLRREIGDRRGEGIAHNNLGVVADSQGYYSEAIQHYQQALAIDRETNDPWGQGYVLNNLGFVYRSQGDYATAKTYCEQALHIRREIGERDGECETLAFLGLVYHHLGEHDRALTHCEQAVQIAVEIGARPTQGYAWTCLGHALTSVGRLAEAADAYREAVAVRRALGEQNRAMESLAGLARLVLLQEDRVQAQAHVEEILNHLAGHNLDGTEEPFLVHLTCYEVLHANADERASAVLQRAYTQLQERAARIEDPLLRRSFLENVAAHRLLIAAWSTVRGEARTNGQ